MSETLNIDANTTSVIASPESVNITCQNYGYQEVATRSDEFSIELCETLTVSLIMTIPACSWNYDFPKASITNTEHNEPAEDVHPQHFQGYQCRGSAAGTPTARFEISAYAGSW